MTIGIPRALAYHRYGTLWKTFFDALHIPYIVSGETNREMLETGAKYTESESCLPCKLYMGHVASLRERCDSIFVPRLTHMGRGEEFCVRFWGLPDVVHNTFSGIKTHGYTLRSKYLPMQKLAFLKLGHSLGSAISASARAYRLALSRQKEADFLRFSQGHIALKTHRPKILLAANPYVSYDPTLGGTVGKLIAQLGATPIFTDAWNRTQCKEASRQISHDLYWTFQRETLGAIHLARQQVDGIILLTAFPCGSDCLANELVLRRVDGLPIIQILLDEHQGSEGLRTRIESFLDMVESRRTKR